MSHETINSLGTYNSICLFQEFVDILQSERSVMYFNRQQLIQFNCAVRHGCVFVGVEVSSLEC